MIKTILQYFLLGSFALASNPEPSNQFKFGDGTTTDKSLVFNRGTNNPKIKWNESQSALQFSNDGSTFFNFSTGGTAGIGNFLLNGEFRYSQRLVPGTLYPINDGFYGPDQWKMHSSGGGGINVNVKRVAETFAASPTQWVEQVQQADATARQYGMVQCLEGSRSLPLRGKTVTFAFYARTTSSQVTALRAGILEWQGTIDSIPATPISSWAVTPNLVANFVYSNTPSNLSLTNSQQQFSVSAPISSSMNNVCVFVWTPTTALQNASFFITQTQLVDSTAPSAWADIAVTPSKELSDLQRYYEKSYDVDTIPGTSGLTSVAWSGYMQTATGCYMTSHPFNTRKYADPTYQIYRDLDGGTGVFCAWYQGGSNSTSYSNSTSKAANQTSAQIFVTTGSSSEVGRSCYCTGEWTAEADLW